MMRARFTLLVVCAAVAALLAAQVASAECMPRNTGGCAEPPSGGNVLTPGGGFSILYAPSEADDPGYRAAISAITGGPVDYFNAVGGTPSVALMSGYDCVYTWANSAYADNVTFGNNLATYVDGGGNVVLGAFCTYTQGNFLSGAIMGPSYCPVVSPTGGNHFSSSNYAGDGTTVIHDGVTNYECTFRDVLDLQGGGQQDGSYLDAEIAHAYNPAAAVIYSNGAGAFQLGCTGEWPLLIANACQAGVVPVELQSLSVD